MLIALLRLLGSLKLAVVLLVVLLAVLAWATVIESHQGRDVAQWYAYHSNWFIGLLGLLAVNILAATLLRFPWGWQRLPFLITHAGLLVLLGGAVLTFVNGIEGRMSIREGETSGTISITDRCQFTTGWQGSHGGQNESPIAFVFEPGPADWPEGKMLEIGSLGDVSVKVLKFYRHARVEENWIEDEEGRGDPAVRFNLDGPDGQSAGERWLVTDQFGAVASIGPSNFLLLRAPVDSMVEDFVRPPAADADESGVLSVHYEGKMYRIPVSKNIGKKFPLGDSKAEVEIVEYLPNAKAVGSGRFKTVGSEPRNPFVELRVHLPGKDKPVRQIAFAKTPLLSLDGVHGWVCPIKFWYHHPAATPASGVELFRTTGGKLFARVVHDKKYVARGEAKAGDAIEMPAGFKMTLLDHYAHARPDVTFYPIQPAAGESDGSEPAALVEVTAGETTRQLWMQRNNETYGMQTIVTPEGRLSINFGDERLPIGYSLKLVKFTHGLNPGRMGDASYSSRVRLIDKQLGINEEREISMNEPLTHGTFTFYQSSYYTGPDGKPVSVFSVAHDPGQWLKYLGSIMVCLGSFTMFYKRTFGFLATPSAIYRRQTRAEEAETGDENEEEKIAA